MQNHGDGVLRLPHQSPNGIGDDGIGSGSINSTATIGDNTCWSDCINSLMASSNNATTGRMFNTNNNKTIIGNNETVDYNSTIEDVCWDECNNDFHTVDLGDAGEFLCWEECVDLNPHEFLERETDRDATNSTASNATSVVGGTGSTFVQIDTDGSNATSNITEEDIETVKTIKYFERRSDITFATINDIISRNGENSTICWKECELITQAPSQSPTEAVIDSVMDLFDAQMKNTTGEMVEWNSQGYTDGEILSQCLSIYGTIFIISVTLFFVLRRLFPRAYNLRSGWIDADVVEPHPIASEYSKTRDGYGWLAKTWLLSDTELSDECGMDTLCLIRVFNWGARLTLVGSLVGCLILMPVYGTAGGDQEGGVERLNTSNVPSDASHGRFIATVLAAYLVFGYVMYSTLQEFEWFYKFRYDFLTKPIPRNYVVYVRNLTEDFRSKKVLIDYFSHFEDPRTWAGDEEWQRLIHKDTQSNKTNAWVSLKIPKLQSLVEQRDKVLEKLERHINIQQLCDRTPKTRDETTGHVITMVDALFVELKQLNASVKIAIERIEHRAELLNPREYRAEDYRNPYRITRSEGENGASRGDELSVNFGGERDSEPEADFFFDTKPIPGVAGGGIGGGIGGSLPYSRDVLHDMQSEMETSEITEEDDMGSSGINDSLYRTALPGAALNIDDLVSNTSSDDDTSIPPARKGLKNLGAQFVRGSAAVVNVARVAETGAKKITQTANAVGKTGAKKITQTANAVGTRAGKVAEKAAQVVLGSKDDDGAPMTAGFVSFSTLKACQAAKQMVHSREVFGMEVLEAPGFDDINWKNVGKNHKELQMGMLLSYVMTGALCVFWTVVITFIASVSSVQGLLLIFPFINEWMEKMPGLEAFLAQISPLMILATNSLLKVILEFLSGLEGQVSGAEVSASLFSKLSAFMIIQVFFVNALSGSLISQLSAISQDPSQIITLLANALPNRSSFFIQMLMVDTFMTLSLELLRASPIAIALVRSVIGPRLTEDERRTTFMGLRPIADPFEFQHAEVLASSVLYFVVFFVYATLAPITSIFMFMCFIIMGAVYRNQFVFCYPTLHDSGGKLWIQFMQIIPTSLLIGEVTISGFLALKTAPVATTLMFPLIGATVLFNVYIRQKHFEATRCLPGCECVEADRKNNLDGSMDLSFVSDHYRQPELRDKEVFPSNASLAMQLKHGMVRQPEQPRRGGGGV